MTEHSYSHPAETLAAKEFVETKEVKAPKDQKASKETMVSMANQERKVFQIIFIILCLLQISTDILSTVVRYTVALLLKYINVDLISGMIVTTYPDKP